MGKVRNIRSVAKPIDLTDRKRKLEEKRNEILKIQESLKKRVNNLLRG